MSAPLKILCVENSSSNVLLIEDYLRQEGFDPITERVETAEALAAALREGEWDAVVIQHNLPGFSVEDSLNMLRASGLELPVIPIGSVPDLDITLPALRTSSHAQRNLRQARAAQQQIEHAFHELVAGIPVPMWIHDRETLAILEVNEDAVIQYGYTRHEFLALHLADLQSPEDLPNFLEELSRDRPDQQRNRSWRHLRKDGQLLEVEISSHPLEFAGRAAVPVLAQDVTARQQAEVELARERNLLRTLIDNVPDFIYAKDRAARFTLANRAIAGSLGLQPEDVLGKTDFDLYPPEHAAQFLADEETVMRSGQPRIDREDVVSVDGQERWLLTTTVPLRDASGNVTGTVGISHDFTERKRADAQIKRQLERLGALRAIDLAINSSLDLRLTLTVFLEQVVTQLGVDAADVWLLDPLDQTLGYAVGRGFRTSDFQTARVRVGESRAGRAALQRRIIVGPGPDDSQPPSRRTGLLVHEDFASYYGVPLIAKGQVLGVLEIYHRRPLAPDTEWLNFLGALAGQAAIAIDNATLFDGLQRSNLDLTLAYDATIAGWSRALDLRDHETEGHSQRVTELTELLATNIGIDAGKLVHARRGAVLHDIGKMGVPDHILLKPGPLTDAEWVIMRLHPTLAYQMLEPIKYLHPALEIPYCHHEKWDGTGYPRGLKGEAIPLSARIFAVVDVWDALRSDRPYRRAWPADRVREYIREQAGQHFDPAMADAFLALDFVDER